MPIHDIASLSDDATIWIFGISPALSDDAVALRLVDSFLASWHAHNVPVVSGRELREGRFLIVAAEKNSETSGCSIDRMFGLIREIESRFGVAMLDSTRVFYRDADDQICDASRLSFRDVATADTIVFDTTAQTLGEVRSGSWERRAGDSWHAALLQRTA